MSSAAPEGHRQPGVEGGKSLSPGRCVCLLTSLAHEVPLAKFVKSVYAMQ